MTVFGGRQAKQLPDLLGQIRELARRHRSLVSRLSSAELLADGIALELSRLEEWLESGGVTPQHTDEDDAPQKGAGRPGQRLRLVAESGAASLEIRPRPDGPSEVCVDGGKRFLLPPLLADLLSALSLDSGLSADGLVGWKTLEEVAELLAKKTGIEPGRHTVTQNIYRLRQELLRRGSVNPFLVQTNRRRGARFALRRRSAGVLMDGD